MNSRQSLISANIAILSLHFLMFLAMLAQVDPHPAGEKGPVIAAVISLGIFSLFQQLFESKFRNYITSAFILVSIIGVGPHKFFLDPNGKEIIPILIFGNIYLFYSIFLLMKEFGFIKK